MVGYGKGNVRPLYVESLRLSPRYIHDATAAGNPLDAIPDTRNGNLKIKSEGSVGGLCRFAGVRTVVAGSIFREIRCRVRGKQYVAWRDGCTRGHRSWYLRVCCDGTG